MSLPRTPIPCRASVGTRRVRGSLVCSICHHHDPTGRSADIRSRSPDDALSYPPKILFTSSTVAVARRLCTLFHDRSRQIDAGIIQTHGAAAGALHVNRARSATCRPGRRNYVPRFGQFADHPFVSTVLRSASSRCRPMLSPRFRVPLEGRFTVLHPCRHPVLMPPTRSAIADLPLL